MLTAQLLWSTRATLNPGTMRRRSGILVAPERRMSSWVITKIAAPVFASFCSFFETEVTWTFITSSRLNCVKSRAGGVCAGLIAAMTHVRTSVTLHQPSDFDIGLLSVRWGGLRCEGGLNRLR